MAMPLKIHEETNSPTINIILDTLKINKQALVFAGTKASAEKTAEEISKKIKGVDLNELAEKIQSCLSKPTKQCLRLSFCIKKGIAFHHSGLVSEQRHLIEDGFRQGIVKVICCTPTLCLSKDTMIWHGMYESKILAYTNKEPVFALSQNKLVPLKAQRINTVQNNRKLLRITSSLGKSIKVTSHHKMLIKRESRRYVAEAETIKKGDRIATIGKLNITKSYLPFVKGF
ncbi:MAG: DEAD/DEAH box helicase domain protein, partial [Parcubacteria group bacterium GW2011_GWA2_46_7]